MLIKSIKLSLENMNRKFTDLSKLKFEEKSPELKKELIKQKIQERPFAYEFYHQFRKMWDDGSIGSIFPNDIVIQAEFNKVYQGIIGCEKIPDFLLHKPSTQENIAIIEFKLASNYSDLKEDFNKLFKFREILHYKFLIEVVIGEDSELTTAKKHIDQLKKLNGEAIIVIYFNSEKWKSNDYKIKYLYQNQ